MRLCSRPGCDAAADLYYKGPWCAADAAQTFGAVIGTLSTIQTPGALGYAGSVASSGRPTGRAAADALDPLSADAAPAPLTEDDVLDVLERDGWRDVELDLFMAKGQTLGEVADEIAARFDL